MIKTLSSKEKDYLEMLFKEKLRQLAPMTLASIVEIEQIKALCYKLNISAQHILAFEEKNYKIKNRSIIFLEKIEWKEYYY